jgi:hypothetical protein
VWLEQLAALPERAFPDGVEDEVVALGVGGEVGDVRSTTQLPLGKGG